MKLNKLSLALLAAGLAGSSAYADATFHIYGSTAYRQVTFQALKTIGLTTIWGDDASTGNAGLWENLSAVNNSKSGATIFRGTVAGHPALGTVTVFASWAGSVGGIKTVAGSQPVSTFLKFPTAWPPTAGTAYTLDNPTVPDLAMADNFQDITPFTSATPGYVDLDGQQVAIVEFLYAAANGTPASVANITHYQVQSLYAAGKINMAQLTGSAADANSFVYAVGRDDDSGTRAIATVDAGIAYGSPLIQYGIVSTPAYAFTPFGPASVWAADGGGYSSGGQVKSALQIARPGGGYTIGGKNAYAISYISVTDWNGSGLATLTYDGVTWSPAAVQQGQYSMWGYETLLYRDADYTGGNPSLQPFADALATELQTEAATIPGTLTLGSMAATRSDDGGGISR